MQDNILKLYHGSENTIPKPLYGKGSSKVLLGEEQHF